MPSIGKREWEKTAGLTGLSGIWPLRPRATSPAARSSSSSTASYEKKAVCGAMITLSSTTRGWSVGRTMSVLGLDDHGRAAGRGDDDVGAQPSVAGDGLGVLGPHLPAGQHLLEQAAQGVIGVRLRLAWHSTV